MGAFPTNDVLAETFGYISIACWIVVLTPRRHIIQLFAALADWRRYEHFGNSFTASDVYSGMRDVYFLIITPDSIIVLQVLYYRKNHSYEQIGECEVPTDSYGSTENRNEEEEYEAIVDEGIKNEHKQKRVLGRIGTFWVATALFIISSIIYIIWSLWPTGSPNDVDLSQLKLLPQLLGWISASFYIFSRIPQILKTFRDESVEGLSIGMFVFSVIGNITFAVSILLESQDPTYVAINMPWLYGSAGTLFFDFTVSTKRDRTTPFDNVLTM
ncbi:hypothetical protein NQZ79_g1878 [Umbelopsis isabellina]|nr:hypothetical protein NQZ79_g1878 [Umbelopsis isabellina]